MCPDVSALDAVSISTVSGSAAYALKLWLDHLTVQQILNRTKAELTADEAAELLRNRHRR